MSVSDSYQNDFCSSDVVDGYFQYRTYEDEKDVRSVIDVLKDLVRLDDEEKLDTLLDVGCGYGVITSLMAKYFNHAIGTDVSANQIKKAREISHPEHVEFKIGLAESLPVADCSVDVITSIFSIHYFNLGRFIQECRRVLKPQGVAIFFCDFPSTFKEIDDGKLPLIDGELKAMKADCLAMARAVSHPARRIFDGLHDVFEEIDWPGKRLLKRETQIDTNLATIRDLYLSIPVYRSFGTTTENPVIRAFENIKHTWKMEDKNKKDANIRATFEGSVIVLNSK